MLQSLIQLDMAPFFSCSHIEVEHASKSRPRRKIISPFSRIELAVKCLHEVIETLAFSRWGDCRHADWVWDKASRIRAVSQQSSQGVCIDVSSMIGMKRQAGFREPKMRRNLACHRRDRFEKAVVVPSVKEALTPVLTLRARSSRPSAERECHDLCVSGPVHAVSDTQASKRSPNIMANWLRAANHSRTFLPSFSNLRIAR